MPALQVRDMPNELYDCLKSSAKTNYRSLAQETIYILEKSLMPTKEHQQSFRARNESTRVRIEKRKEIFAALSEINAREKEISSQEIEQIYLESKQEFNERTNLSSSLEVMI